jgi:hypothetical protein
MLRHAHFSIKGGKRSFAATARILTHPAERGHGVLRFLLLKTWVVMRLSAKKGLRKLSLLPPVSGSSL